MSTGSAQQQTPSSTSAVRRMRKNAPRSIASSPDGEAAIDELEARIVRAADEGATFHGLSAREAAAHRRAAEALARAACDQLRAEHRARRRA